MAALRSSIELFDSIGMDTLRKRSRLLTSYMENMIHSINNSNIDIITPSNSDDRGSQLSLAIDSDEKDIELLKSYDLSDKDISQIVQFIAYFYYIYRVADGLGLEPEEFIDKKGYKNK